MSKITYSPSVDALAIHLRDADVDDTVEVEPGIMFDYDNEGKVIGVEILDFVARVKEAGANSQADSQDALSETLGRLPAST